MKKLFAISLLLWVITACTSVSNVAKKIGKSQESIIATEWILADGVKGKSPVLSIQEGKVSGNAGCNNYNGELVLDASNGTFSVKNMTSTRMACDNLSVEKNFLSMLSSANKYIVSGNTLELYKDHLLLMKLSRQ